jgi:hypothetical protein
MECHYFVLENSISTNKQPLPSGVFIASVSADTPFNFADSVRPQLKPGKHLTNV